MTLREERRADGMVHHLTSQPSANPIRGKLVHARRHHKAQDRRNEAATSGDDADERVREHHQEQRIPTLPIEVQQFRMRIDARFTTLRYQANLVIESKIR